MEMSIFLISMFETEILFKNILTTRLINKIYLKTLYIIIFKQI